MKPGQRWLLAAILAAIGGALAGHVATTRWMEERSTTAATAGPAPTAAAPERKPLYWYDPMYPQRRFDQPGKSPFMDMPLVPKYADEGSAQAGVPAIDPRVAQNLAIRHAEVEKTRFGTTLEVPATIAFNERDVAVVQARTAAFVERVYLRAPGDVIAAGAPLADLLVPEWAALQIEYLALRKRGDVELQGAARQRMLLAGMPATLIDEVERSGDVRSIVTIRAPSAGVVQELGVRAGMAVTPGLTLARINGLSPVWIEGAVPSAQAAVVRVGQVAEAVVEGLPGAPLRGKVIAILPEVNRDSRTLRVRVETPNPGQALRAGMLATLRLRAAETEALTVPAEAVIRTSRGARVIVVDAEGRTRPVAVDIGREANGRTEVTGGLREGERVVASGQFLIDSEANLTGALARLDAGGGAATEPLHRGRGRVTAIDGDTVTLAHGPIPSLNWGPMTMTFRLAVPQVPAQAAVGDTVEFAFTERNGEHTLRELRRVQP